MDQWNRHFACTNGIVNIPFGRKAEVKLDYLSVNPTTYTNLATSPSLNLSIQRRIKAVNYFRKSHHLRCLTGF